MKKYKNLLYFFSVALIFGAILFYAVAPKITFAVSFSFFGLGDIAKEAIGGAVGAMVKFIVAPVLKLIIVIFSWFLGFAININNEIFNPSNTFIVGTWQKARDIANLGFVLGIIVIAFGTILRMENYGFKKTLTKLIIAALLVNFSLMICAGFNDLANVATRSIQKDITVDGITNKIMQLSGLKDFQNQEPGLNKLIGDTGKGVATGLAAPIFSIISMIILLITLTTIVIMMFVRYVWVGLLVVLSPLAWLCSIFPATQSLWKKWWSMFIRWIIFAPLMMLFLVFATTSSYTGGSQGFTNIGSAFATPIATLGNYLIFIGLLLGGLIITNSLSLAGSKGAINLATGITMGAGLWAARLAARGAGRLGATRPIGGQAMRMATQGRNRFTQAIGRGVVNATAYTTAFGRGIGARGVTAPTSLWGSIINRTRYHRAHPLPILKFGGKKKKKGGGGGHGGSGGGQASQGEEREEPEETET